MLLNTELLLLIHTYWGSAQTTEQRRKSINAIIATFSQMKLDRNEKMDDKAEKKALIIKNTLTSALWNMIPKFVLTCDLNDMVWLVILRLH